ncbi:hypothetical protein [Kribbella sp. NPDC049584]|uniref:hypothetical protein n=1 Tax=Kribbella sp. NPDC049584 TaxID=3154833 RepID=UPI00342A9BBE
MGSWGQNRKQRRLEQEVNTAVERVEQAKEGQRDAQRLRGMPGSKQAVKTAASNIHSAQKAAKKAQRKLDKHERG